MRIVLQNVSFLLLLLACGRLFISGIVLESLLLLEEIKRSIPTGVAFVFIALMHIR